MANVNTWFTSDLHLGHRKLAEMRGYESTEAHDAEIEQRWNSVVAPTDRVWIAGDVCLHPRELPKVDRLNGTKDLVLGNHDRPFSGSRDAYKAYAEWTPHFRSIQSFARFRYAGTQYLISHFPYSGDHTENERYTQYRLRDEGLWLLHGHVHSPIQRWGERQIHIGLDAWNLTPVSMNAIALATTFAVEMES